MSSYPGSGDHFGFLLAGVLGPMCFWHHVTPKREHTRRRVEEYLPGHYSRPLWKLESTSWRTQLYSILGCYLYLTGESKLRLNHLILKKKRLLHQAKPRMRGLSSGTIDIWWKSIWQTNCPCLLVNHERHKLGHRRNCPLSNKAEEGRRDLYFISNHMLFIHATDLSLHTSNITPRSIVKTLLLVIYNLDRHETHPPTYITKKFFFQS